MNRVYKSVWSKTKNMYVTVCKYAGTHTKSVLNRNMRCTTVAGVLFSLLSCGTVFPVYAGIPNGSGYNTWSSANYNDFVVAYYDTFGQENNSGAGFGVATAIRKSDGHVGELYFTYNGNNVATGAKFNDLTAKVTGGSADPNSIHSLSVNGKTITYTRGNGTTGTITTQDTNTTYSAATSSNLGLVKTGSNITNSGGTISLTKANVVAALGYTPPTADTNTTYANMKAATASAAGTAGLVPAPAAGKQNAFLRGDGTWVVPTDTNTTYGAATSSALGLVKTGSNITNSGGTISLTKDNVVAALGYTPPTTDTNTTYGNMKAATASAAGTAGLVPAPAAGKQTAFLRGDGTWVVPTDTNTTYSAVTQSANGLMTAADKKKLDGITAGANAYSLPTATGSVLGGIKTGANITNSSGTISLTKANVTAALGYTPPTQDTNTTYAAMSADELNTGTATTSRSMTAKVVSDYVKGKTDDKISGLSVNGSTITYTKGNGTSGTLSVPAVSYPVLALSDVNTGTSTTANTISAKVLNDYVSGKVLTETNARSDADTVLSNRIGSLSADGNYIHSSATNDVVTNLLALDTQLKATDIVAIKYDGNDHALATLGGTNGTKLTNLKQGTLSASSTDAVTGAQLHAVKQDITGFAENIQKNSDNIRSLNSSVTSALSSVAASGLLVDTMDVSKADSSLNNLTESGKQVLKQYASDAVQEYIAAQQNNNSAPMAFMMYAGNSNTLSVNDAGNGSLHVGEGSYVNGTSSIAIGVGNQVNANNSGAFGDPSIINADESYILGNDDTINIGAIGSFIVGNDGVSDAKGGLLFGSNTKATVEAEDGMALGNRTEVSAKNAIALGSGSIANTENTLSIGNSELKRKIVNVADGDISQNSSEAVTGAQLFLTNEKVQQNTDAIAKKANIDGGNINTSDWATKLGIGKVEDGNTDLITGGTVYDAIQSVKGNELVQTNGDAITIGANSTASVIDVSNANGQGRAITGIVTDVNDASSAANVGYVNQVGENIVNATNQAFQKVDNKINKAGANAAAIANLPTPTFDGEEKWAFAVGIGRYQGETAGAVGAFYKPTDNVIARVSGSFGNGDEMVGAGVAVSLNKANTPVVSKAQLVRTINAQANEIQQVKQENALIRSENANMKADYEGKIAAQNEEIAQLKVMMADLAAKVK